MYATVVAFAVPVNRASLMLRHTGWPEVDPAPMVPDKAHAPIPALDS